MTMTIKNTHKIMRGGVILRPLTQYGHPKFLNTDNPNARPLFGRKYHYRIAIQYINAGYNEVSECGIHEPNRLDNSFVGTAADKEAINQIINYKLTYMANKWKPPPLAGCEYKKIKKHFIKLSN